MNFFIVEKHMDGIHMDKLLQDKKYINLHKLMEVWIMVEEYLNMQLFGYGYQVWVFQMIIEYVLILVLEMMEEIKVLQMKESLLINNYIN